MKFKAYGSNIIAHRRLGDDAAMGGVFEVVEATPDNIDLALLPGKRFVALVATPLPCSDLFVVHTDHVVALVDAEAT
mgnify:FL=1